MKSCMLGSVVLKTRFHVVAALFCATSIATACYAQTPRDQIVDKILDTLKTTGKISCIDTTLNDCPAGQICNNLPGHNECEPGNLLAPGEACTAVYQCVTDCIGFICVDYASEGEACRNDQTCGNGLYCDTHWLWGTNTCKFQRKNDGDSCYRGGECASGRCSSKNKCIPDSTPLYGPGVECLDNTDCASGNCILTIPIKWVCTSPKYFPNKSCSHSQECGSGLCINSKCQPHYFAGSVDAQDFSALGSE